MGRYDDPANIDLVTAQTGHEKIFYIGYSQGTIQMIYGLSHNEDTYFADKVIKAIMLAPCAIANGITNDDGTPDIDYYLNNDFKMQGLGIYSIKGPHWLSNLEKICTHLPSKKLCHILTLAGVGIEPYSVQD